MIEKIEEGQLGVEVDSPADGPPLIITCQDHLTPEGVARLRQTWADSWKKDVPYPKIVIIDRGMDLYQLINGKWTKLS